MNDLPNAMKGHIALYRLAPPLELCFEFRRCWFCMAHLDNDRPIDTEHLYSSAKIFIHSQETGNIMHRDNRQKL